MYQYLSYVYFRVFSLNLLHMCEKILKILVHGKGFKFFTKCSYKII